MVLSDQKASGHESLEAIAENVGRDAFFGVGQELAEVSTIAEGDVSKDEEAALITERLDGSID